MYLLHFVLKLEELVKVAKTNYVVMKLAADGHKHDSQVNIVYAFYLGGSCSVSFSRSTLTTTFKPDIFRDSSTTTRKTLVWNTTYTVPPCSRY